MSICSSSPPGYSFLPWRVDSSLELCVDPVGGPVSQEALLGVAVRAARLWEEAGEGRISLRVLGGCHNTGARRGDGLSVIGWRAIPGEIAGRALVVNYAGGAAEADIVLDPTEDVLLKHDCLATVLLHELGHVLGLGHAEARPSIMAPKNSCQPELSPTDIEAIRHLYP